MAVYTALSAREISALIRHWDVQKLTAYGGIAAGVENTTYWLKLGAHKYVLSIYEQKIQTSELAFFLSLMQHLADGGLPVARPLATRKGAQTACVKDKPCALMPFLPGASLRAPSAPACRRLGAALADLHAAAASFAQRRANPLGVQAWHRLLRDAHKAKPLPTAHAQNAAHALDHYAALWPAPNALPRGLIHSDLFPDNVFFRRGEISGLMDFSFACEDFLLYDVAIALNAWAFAPKPPWRFDAVKARALLGGYQERRAFTEAEKAALPTLAGGAALQFFLTRQREWARRQTTALKKKASAAKDPQEYFGKLQFWRTDGASLSGLI